MPSIQNPPSAPLLLAFDTSSSLGSVALARGDTLVGSTSFQADHGHSRRLLPAIDSLFSEAGIQPTEIERFAVVVGPGSFTGLRVALACVRGLAGPRPCFGALATDTLAWAARGGGRGILALTDLFHGEVFGAVHDVAGALRSGHESGDLDAVMNTLLGYLKGSLVAVGSAAIKHRERIVTLVPGIAFLELPEGLAPHLAALAAARTDTGAWGPASDLMPFYLRDPLTRGLLNTQPKLG